MVVVVVQCRCILKGQSSTSSGEGINTEEINASYLFLKTLQGGRLGSAVFVISQMLTRPLWFSSTELQCEQRRTKLTHFLQQIFVQYVQEGTSLDPSNWEGKCQIIKLFNSSLSLYSWLVIKQYSINVRAERQWVTLSRLDGLNPCKLLGSTDWQLMSQQLLLIKAAKMTLKAQTFQQ